MNKKRKTVSIQQTITRLLRDRQLRWHLIPISSSYIINMIIWSLKHFNLILTEKGINCISEISEKKLKQKKNICSTLRQYKQYNKNCIYWKICKQRRGTKKLFLVNPDIKTSFLFNLKQNHILDILVLFWKMKNHIRDWLPEFNLINWIKCYLSWKCEEYINFNICWLVGIGFYKSISGLCQYHFAGIY